MDFKARASGYFKTHPKVDEFHFTTDGTAFFQLTDAESHAKTLKDRAVATIARKDMAAKAKATDPVTEPATDPVTEPGTDPETEPAIDSNEAADDPEKKVAEKKEPAPTKNKGAAKK